MTARALLEAVANELESAWHSADDLNLDGFADRIRAIASSLAEQPAKGEGHPFVGVVCPECNASYYASASNPQPSDPADAVAQIIHSPDAVSRMVLLPAGIALGHGTHNLYATPAHAQRQGVEASWMGAKAILEDAQVNEAFNLFGVNLDENAAIGVVQAIVGLLNTHPQAPSVDAAAVLALAVEEIERLRAAMFATYCAAANGAAKTKLIQMIEKERDAYEAGYCVDKLRALAQGAKQ